MRLENIKKLNEEIWHYVKVLSEVSFALKNKDKDIKTQEILEILVMDSVTFRDNVVDLMSDKDKKYLRNLGLLTEEKENAE